MTGLVVAIHDSEGPMDTPWGSDLRLLEQRVTKSDEEGIRARWKSGQKLLQKRGDKKKLPKGLLDEVSSDLGTDHRELQRRLKFAEKFPTEDELRHTVSQFPTWSQITRQALPDKRQPTIKKPSKYGLLFRQWRKELQTVGLSDLSPADLKVLDQIQEEIVRIYDLVNEASDG